MAKSDLTKEADRLLQEAEAVEIEEKAEPLAEVKTEPAPKANPFDLLVKKTVEVARKTGTAGKTGSSAASRSILGKLRDLGSRLEGCTVEELRQRLQLTKSPQQTRKAIRLAQEAAVESRDLVYCRKTNQSVGADGSVITLRTEVSRYFIISGDLAETAGDEAISSLRAIASDWVWRGDVKAETRSRLAELGRAHK
ncbi:hypothetical protein LCGC14_1654980 [marine sediment metagenome]|uniref:Uncharacterized protein n=1 Tax=marine sediment metagenome TaxID=412755 RepID=A0A0F9KW31_9ZZZZ